MLRLRRHVLGEAREIAGPLADDKLEHAAATGARWLVSGDVACLLHLEGRRRRTGVGPEPVHVAAAAGFGAPGRRAREPSDRDAGATLTERATSAIANPGLQAAMENLDRRLFTARDVADDFPDLKDRAAALRRETLADLPGGSIGRRPRCPHSASWCTVPRPRRTPAGSCSRSPATKVSCAR